MCRSRRANQKLEMGKINNWTVVCFDSYQFPTCYSCISIVLSMEAELAFYCTNMLQSFTVPRYPNEWWDAPGSPSCAIMFLFAQVSLSLLAALPSPCYSFFTCTSHHGSTASPKFATSHPCISCPFVYPVHIFWLVYYPTNTFRLLPYMMPS